jgi:excisionase family DNA binding protein
MEANTVAGPTLASLPDALTVEEGRSVLRLGRNAIYEAIGLGEIPPVRIGRRILIPRARPLRLLGTESGINAPGQEEIGGDSAR